MNNKIYNFAKVWQALKKLNNNTALGEDAYKLDILCKNFTMNDSDIETLNGYLYLYFTNDTIFRDLWLLGKISLKLIGTSLDSLDVIFSIKNLVEIRSTMIMEFDTDEDGLLVVGETNITLNNSKHSNVNLVGNFRTFLELTYDAVFDDDAMIWYIFGRLYDTYEEEDPNLDPVDPGTDPIGEISR